ncbi:MAG: ABC transporter permease [Thermoleophilia bacterium]|jgi:ABC-2 type transport system permease protein
MSGTPTVWLVARREIDERLRSRYIRIVTALSVVLVVAVIVAPSLFHKAAKPATVGLLYPSAQALAPELQRAAIASGVKVRLSDLMSASVAQAQLRQKTLDVALMVTSGQAVAEVRQDIDPTLRAVLQAVVSEEHLRESLAANGLSPTAVAQALTPTPLSVAVLQPAPPDQAAHALAAIIAGVLLYMTIMLYGQAVATGVAQEKTSRTAEVLLAVVRPSRLLAGKVLGIGLVGFAQIGLTVAAGLIANAAVQRAQIPSTVWVLLPSILLWFLLGFTLYAFACAAAGALVARQEELAFVTMPITMLLVVSFLLTYVAVGSPGALWLTVLSFVPPMAPVLMPVRIALTHVPVWQIALSVALTIAAAVLVAATAARIYSFALVRGGAKLSWGEALRLSRP